MFGYNPKDSFATISDSLILAVQGVTDKKKKNSKYAPKSMIKESVVILEEAEQEVCPKCKKCSHHCQCDNMDEAVDQTSNEEDDILADSEDDALNYFDYSKGKEIDDDEDGGSGDFVGEVDHNDIRESYVHNNPLMEAVFNIMEAGEDIDDDGTSGEISSPTMDRNKKSSRPVKNPFRKTLGFELWRGKSPMPDKTGNHAEIVCIATMTSSNRKTGPVGKSNMIQTWIIRTDMPPREAMNKGLDGSSCGTCPFRSRASGGEDLCYVNTGQAPNGIYAAWKRGKYPKLDPTNPEMMDVFRGRKLRMGSYGEATFIPFDVWKPILAVVSGKVGFTHAWKEPFAKPFKGLLRASTETKITNDAAMKDGWVTFYVASPGEPEIDARMCPSAKTKGKIKCVDCLGCQGNEPETDPAKGVGYPGMTGAKTLTVPAHGAKVGKNAKQMDKYKNRVTQANKETPQTITPLTIMGKKRMGESKMESIIHKLQESFNTDPTVEQMRAWLAPEAKQIGADDFDIEAAIYWCASDWHGGQSSNLYSALSTSEFTPGQNSSSVESEGELASMLYDELEAKTGLHSTEIEDEIKEEE